jgi:hypothetical protein
MPVSGRERSKDPHPAAALPLAYGEQLLTTTRRDLCERGQKGHVNDGSDAPKLKP